MNGAHFEIGNWEIWKSAREGITHQKHIKVCALYIIANELIIT